MKSDSDLSTLIDALRADLPSERDSARLRARLSALGVAATSGLSASAAAAATAAGGASKAATAGAIGSAAAQATSFGLALKVGVVAAVSASAVVGPMWVLASRSSSAPANAASVAPVRPPAQRSMAPAKRGAATNSPARATTEAASADLTTAPDTATTSAPELVAPPRPAAPTPVAQRPVAAANPTRAIGETQPKNAPSVAGFDATSTNSAPETTLREETRLIDGAVAALRAGDKTRAAALLGEHAQRFPNGLLRRERARALHKLDELNAIKP